MFCFWGIFKIFPLFMTFLIFFNFLRFFEIWPIFNSQFCKFGYRYDLNDCCNWKIGTRSFIFGVKLVAVKIFRKVIQMWQKFKKLMKNPNFCHFWTIFCHFLPIFAFFPIFSCLNTVLRVFAEFYGPLIIISWFSMGCEKIHIPPRNRVILDAPRNRTILLRIVISAFLSQNIRAHQY